MQCPNCGRDIGIKREFCPSCGKRVTVAFDQIAASVHVDAASRRGENLERFLLWGLMALIALGVVIYGINYLWDRPLVYDGSSLPAVDAPRIQLAQPSTVKAAYHDIFQLSLPAGQASKVFSSRLDPIKSELRASNGGNDQCVSAIDKGLGYLLTRQAPDGGWQVTNQGNSYIKPDKDKTSQYQWGRTGLTALALLAFLGEGHTWYERVNDQPTRYNAVVERAIRFLVKSQDEVNGRFGPAEGNFMYNHGLATLAIAEAAGMSGDPFLFESAQKGVNLIQRIQAEVGGWKYKDEISGNPDTSVSSWQVQALLAAREAGLNVDPEKLRRSLKFFEQVTEQSGAVRYDLKDRAAFSPPGVALMMRRWLGEKDTAPLRMLTRKTLSALPRWERGWKDPSAAEAVLDKRARTFDPYAWYFGSYGAFFQGGEDWKTWNTGSGPQTAEVKVGLIPALLELQESDGAWRANDNWTSMAGEVYSTALCILALQVYYRIQ